VIAQAFPALRRVAADNPPNALPELVDPHLQRQRIFAELRALFARLAGFGPMIIVIDDMQWSDMDSLALLSALLRPPAAPAMLLIAVRRPGGVLSQIPLRGNVLLLQLGPLVRQESTELVSRLLSSLPNVETTRERIEALAEEGQGQ